MALGHSGESRRLGEARVWALGLSGRLGPIAARVSSERGFPLRGITPIALGVGARLRIARTPHTSTPDDTAPLCA